MIDMILEKYIGIPRNNSSRRFIIGSPMGFATNHPCRLALPVSSPKVSFAHACGCSAASGSVATKDEPSRTAEIGTYLAYCS